MAAPDDTARNKTDAGKLGPGRTDARDAAPAQSWGSLPPLADGVP